MRGILVKHFELSFLAFFILSQLFPTVSNAETSQQRVEIAKKEGKVNFYFVWNLTHGQAIKKIFQKKYPSIEVNLYRSGGSSMVNKLDIEARTGRNDADVIIMSDLYWQTLMDRKLVTPYCSHELEGFPNEFKNQKCLWTALNINTHVIVYNTEMVPKEDRPKNLQDLLNPKFKGKMVIDTTDDRWFTMTLDKMGEEKGLAYMKKLAAQNLNFRGGHTLMVQLLAAGEFPINVVAYGYLVEYMKGQGATLDWAADEPVTVTAGVASLACHAPNPEAAKLFFDVLLSKEGQKEITKFNRVATRIDIPPNPPHLVEGLKMYPVKPELARDLPKRVKQFREIFGIQ